MLKLLKIRKLESQCMIFLMDVLSSWGDIWHNVSLLELHK